MQEEFDIKVCINNLRPVFHSEADLQFALAWEIKKTYSTAKVRLEYPKEVDGKMIYVDIVVLYNNKEYYIELKYKTKLCNTKIGAEEYNLKNQSAQNLGRYDFLKDVQRVEKLGKGYAIMLTNDMSYVEKDGKDTRYNMFSLKEDRKITKNKKYDWGDGFVETSVGKRRLDGITFKNDYTIHWENMPNNIANLKYCLIKVND